MLLKVPGTPPYFTFPTAWPGSGVIVTTKVSGQHATNPHGYAITLANTRRVKRSHPKSQIWQWSPGSVRYTQYPKPADFNAAIQRYFSQYWKTTLTTAQRTAWATWSATHALTNTYGTSKFMSPYGAFMNLNRLYGTPTVPPNIGYPFPTSVTFTNPPPTWPTLAALPLTAPNLKLYPKTYFSSAGPVWGIYLAPTWPTPPTGLWLKVWLSYPGRIGSSPRTQRFPSCTASPGLHPPYVQQPENCIFQIPNTAVGTRFSIMWVTLSNVSFGISPPSYADIAYSIYPP